MSGERPSTSSNIPDGEEFRHKVFRHSAASSSLKLSHHPSFDFLQRTKSNDSQTSQNQKVASKNEDENDNDNNEDNLIISKQEWNEYNRRAERRTKEQQLIKQAPMPSLEHLTRADYTHVYEPSDDTFLLLDALQFEFQHGVFGSFGSMLADHWSPKPLIVLEVGCGTGAVSVFVRQQWQADGHLDNALLHSYATDINPKALAVTQQTDRVNVRVQTDLNQDDDGDARLSTITLVQCDLAEALLPQLQHQVDVVLFNPPYVPTPDEDVVMMESGGNNHGVSGSPLATGVDIRAAWAGGLRGRRVVDRFLPQLTQLLRPQTGLCYLVTVDDNEPIELAQQLWQEHQLDMKPLFRRRAQNEYLSVQKIQHIPPPEPQPEPQPEQYPPQPTPTPLSTQPPQHPAVGSIWKHLKRGSSYQIEGVAHGKSSDKDERVEGQRFAIYQSIDGENEGTLYIRAVSDFLDGRFVCVDGPGPPDSSVPPLVAPIGEDEEENDNDNEQVHEAEEEDEEEEARVQQSSTPETEVAQTDSSVFAIVPVPSIPQRTDSEGFGEGKPPGSLFSCFLPSAVRSNTKSLMAAFYDLGSRDVQVVQSVLEELADMGLHSPKHKKKVKYVMAQGAAPMGVLQAMRNHGAENATVADQCLDILVCLTEAGETECLSALVELEGVVIILDLMQRHKEPRHIRIHISGSSLLCDLSSLATPAEAQRILKHDGIDRIIEDMQEFPRHVLIQRQGCKCLANLARHERLKQEIRQKGGVSAIGATLETFPEGSSTYNEARKAMVCFFQ